MQARKWGNKYSHACIATMVKVRKHGSAMQIIVGPYATATHNATVVCVSDAAQGRTRGPIELHLGGAART